MAEAGFYLWETTDISIKLSGDGNPLEGWEVPAGCEPLYRQCILEQGTSQAKFLLTIEMDGTLKCARYSTGASAIAVPNNAWLNINATYVSAS